MEWGGLHSCLHNKKKAEQAKNQQLFLDPLENRGHRAKCHSPNSERDTSRENQRLSGAETPTGPAAGSTLRVVDSLVKAKCGLA